MICYLCKATNFLKVDGRVRDDHNLSVIKCSACGLVTLDSFEHIKKGFYEDSKMLENSFKRDYSAWSKINIADNRRRIKDFKKDIINKNILDFGCGTGDFLKYAKKYAKSISAIEIDKGLNQRLSAIEGLSLFSSLKEIDKKQKFDVIFLFHVLEHVENPASLLENLGEHLSESGKIIVEVPNVDDALLTLYDCEDYKAFYYWKCHLFYYSADTLQKVFLKAGFSTDYIKQVQRYPLSNHLLWLKEGKPGGHHVFNYLDSDALNVEYKNQLADVGKCDTLVARIKNA